MGEQQLRVAVIGTGAISRDQHIVGWLQIPWVKLVALVDRSEETVARAAEQFHVARWTTDYRQLLDDPGIDVVDVCVPSALHAEVTIAALQAGKHVLCEKPMATSRAAAAAMLDAYWASGKKLMIAQHLRFSPTVMALRSYLQELDPGHIYYARGQWLRRRRLPARAGFTERALSGGGALYDIGVHVLDLAWWLMGNPAPTSASGRVFNHLARRNDLGSEWGTWDPETIDVEDFAAGMISFENGAVLALESSWLGFQPERDFSRIQLFGTRAGAIWPECRIFGERNRRPWNIQLAAAKGERPHREAIRQFAHAVLEDKPVPLPPEQSANTIAMLEALYRSSAARSEQPVEAFQAARKPNSPAAAF